MNVAIAMHLAVAAAGFAAVSTATPCPQAATAGWAGVRPTHHEGAPTALPYTLVMRSVDVPAVTCFVIDETNRGENKRDSGTWRQLQFGGNALGPTHDAYDDHVRDPPLGIGCGPERWNKGHLMADRYFKRDEDKANTYFMANMVPQRSNCNGGWWSHKVEADIQKYAEDPRYEGHMVFVGTEGEVENRNIIVGSSIPTEYDAAVNGVKHVKWMWAAVCKQGKGGFMMAAGNPNEPKCGDQYLSLGNFPLPKELHGVFGNLEEYCGTVEKWASWEKRKKQKKPSSRSEDKARRDIDVGATVTRAKKKVASAQKARLRGRDIELGKEAGTPRTSRSADLKATTRNKRKLID
uniref:DNA/RNA non-specific endonuclease/pyrophosphatase/phosphodiesterase domain-containing protein n=1 Tax=Neobodo designis TaxID=312471 RepID=A0A7S1LP53_NEODS